MTQELLIGLTAFAVVMSVTPGPNNLMLMASGVNFGFRRTAPHMLGVIVGFLILVLLTGVGLVRLFEAVPAAYAVMKVVSAVYLAYLAWRIATASPVAASGAAAARPMTFLEAALFQWVNPKGWAMALSAMTIYAPAETAWFGVALVAAVFFVISVPNSAAWTLMGVQLRRFLQDPARVRAFNWICAALLIASLYPVLAG